MEQPLTLVAEPGDGTVRLAVKGQSPISCEARYELHVESGARGSLSRSTQRGVARLSPGKAVTLATVTVGKVQSGEWNARLSVTPCRGEPYELSVNGLNGG